MTDFEALWRKELDIPEGMVGVVVMDDPNELAAQRTAANSIPVEGPGTTILLVPEKSGWCDDCWDVHRHNYCPEDVLEKQFQLLEHRAGEIS